MKKKLTGLLIGALAFVAAFGVGCGKDECKHDWTQATCSTLSTCKVCGETTGEMLAHQEGAEWETVTEPTIEKEGTQVKKCTVCGGVAKTQALPKKTPITLTVSTATPEFGSVVADKTAFDPDMPGECTVTATPQTGYAFIGWYAGESLVSKDVTYTFTMPVEDYVLTAQFKKMSVWDGSVATTFAGGDGTKAAPYQIATASQFALMRNKINTRSNMYYNAYYVLTTNIDLNGKSWWPIGSYYYEGGLTSDSARFGGTFEGSGYEISNFNVVARNQYEQYFGLFGWLYGATINDLGVTDYTIDVANRTKAASYGGLAGGGFRATINNCYAKSDITVSGGNYQLNVGGLIGGVASDCEISSCYASGNTSATIGLAQAYVGGLIGIASGSEDCKITDCYASGDISLQAAIANNGNELFGGGLLGYCDGKVENSYALGDVTVSALNAIGGGLAGAANGATKNCYATGDVTVTSNRSTGTSSYAGGLFGKCLSGCSARNSYSSGVVTLNNAYDAYCGGFMGNGYNGTVENCYATGNVVVNGSVNETKVGGFAGANNGILNSNYATGDVSVATDTAEKVQVGGFLGYCYGYVIENSYATGDVSVNATNASEVRVGGFIGCNNTLIKCSYGAGAINVIAGQNTKVYAGGFTGVSLSGADNCLGLGNVAVSGGGEVAAGGFSGRFSGLNGGGYTAECNCGRYDGQAVTVNTVSGATNSDGAAYTLTQLDGSDLYKTTLGWSETIWDWTRLDFANSEYPVLLSKA